MYVESENQANEQNRNRPRDTENVWMAARREGAEGAGWKGGRRQEGKALVLWLRCTLVAAGSSWGCKVQRREYGQ